MRPHPARPSGRLAAIATVAFVVIGVVFAHIAVGFPGPWDPDRFQTYPDAVADWLTTRAAFDGADPYQPVDQLADLYGVPIGDLPEDAIHPRFPGGLLVQAPLLLASWESVVSWMTVVNLSLLAVAGWALWRWRGAVAVPLALPILVLTPLFVELVAHGGHVGLLVILLIGAWWSAERDREALAGLLVALLGVLRGFPLLLIPALWIAGRRRAAVSGAAGFVVLNLVGLVLFDIGIGESVTAMASGSSLFGTDVHNSSIAGLLTRIGVGFSVAVPLGMAGALGWWAWLLARRPQTVDSAMAVTIPVMVLASPLAWPSYHLLFMPVMACLLAHRQARQAGLLGGTAAGAYVVWHLTGVGVSGLVSGVTNGVAAVTGATVPGRGSGTVDRAVLERRTT